MKKGVLFWIRKRWFFLIKNSSHKSFYKVVGMRRSGNHALINWMLAQMPGLTCFNNNMGPFHRPEDTPIKRIVLNNGKARNLIISHEDRKLEDILIPYKPDFYGKSSQQFTILLLRDPYNWLASQYAWEDELGERFRTDEVYRNSLIDKWKDYARQYLQWKKNEADRQEEPQIAVNYNRWVLEKNYREELAGRLNLIFSDKGRDKVDGQGHGSSFSGTEFHGRGTELKVLERWKNYLNDPVYQSFLDEELRGFGEEIFGMGLV